MTVFKEIFSIVQDTGLTLVILAVIMRVRQDPKHIVAYAFFIGFLLLI